MAVGRLHTMLNRQDSIVFYSYGAKVVQTERKTKGNLKILILSALWSHFLLCIIRYSDVAVHGGEHVYGKSEMVGSDGSCLIEVVGLNIHQTAHQLVQ